MKLDRIFTYDPIYRLLSATGRECDISPPNPWDSGPRCTDLTRTRPYIEKYVLRCSWQYAHVKNIRRWRETSLVILI